MEKKFKEWSYDYNAEKRELTILINDTELGWCSLATLSDIKPKRNEDLGDTYNDLITEIIDESGYKSIWLE